MDSKTYSGTFSKDDARVEVNRLVCDIKQELRTLSIVTDFTTTDLAELFVRNLLLRLGVPLEHER